MKLDKVALGLALGMVWGLWVLLMTVWLVVSGWQGEHLGLLALCFPGYSVSWFGAVVGLVYGFIDGLVCGWLVGWLYNRFSKA